MKKTITMLALAFGLLEANAQAVVTDFETFTLSANSSYSPGASTPFQTNTAVYPSTWVGGFWSGGFVYTNKYDSSTAGFTNLYGVKPLKGYNSSNIYLVGQDRGVIRMKAPFETFEGFYITNTTYAYKAIKNGDNFCRKFGDTTGTHTGTTVPQGSVADYFKVTVKGYFNGVAKTDSVEYYLADYRFANNSLDYVLKNWQYVNTTILGQVDSVKFFMYSTDVGQFGINTPLFFGIDNVAASDNYVGINENTLSSRLAVYPNPFNNNLNIELKNSVSDKIEITILDFLGRSVYNSVLKGMQHSLNLEGLQKGIYFIEIVSDENKAVKKLIKE